MKILTIENKAGKIKLDEHVDEYSRKKLAEEISQTFGATAHANGADFGEMTNAADNGIDTLDIEIHSPGGSVLEGFLIYNELVGLRARGVEVTATVNTLAASMASVIAMAADKVRIVPNGKMMIHDVSMAVRGNAAALSKMAALCDQTSNEIAGVYAQKTGKTVDEMREKMKDETWLDAKQAVELGLADEIFDMSKPKPKLANMNLIDRLTSPSAAEALERITALEAQIATDETNHAQAIADLTEKLTTAEAALQEAATIKPQLDAATAQITTLQGSLDAVSKELADAKVAIQKAEDSASQRAVEIAAAAGLEKPLEIEGESEEVDHFANMAKMTPAERTTYFRENQKAIKAQLRK